MRQDAQCPEQGRSERKAEAYIFTRPPRAAKTAPVPCWYVEALSDARTKPGKGRVLAPSGWAGVNTAFFNILPRH
jgi:hypothetical protein